MSFLRYGFTSEVSTSGVSTLLNVQGKFTNETNYVREILQYGDFTNTSDIFGFAKRVSKPQIKLFDPRVLDLNKRVFIYGMIFKDSFIHEERYPDHLFGALAKVGGLLALAKVASVLLQALHQWQFEKDYSYENVPQTDISDTLKEQESQAFK